MNNIFAIIGFLLLILLMLVFWYTSKKHLYQHYQKLGEVLLRLDHLYHLVLVNTVNGYYVLLVGAKAQVVLYDKEHPGVLQLMAKYTVSYGNYIILISSIRYEIMLQIQKQTVELLYVNKLY